MRYVAAYLLAALGGNSSPSTADLEKILSSVGIEVEGDRIKKIVSELNGKNLAQLIEEGLKKLASVPSGGGGAPAAAAAAPASSDAAPAEDKKEVVDEESGSDEDMGFGLFD